MKIAIDCRMIRSGGIGSFLKGILKEFIKEKDNQYLLIGDEKELSVFQTDNTEILHCVIPIFSVTEMFEFPSKKINSYDCFFTPNYNIPGRIKIPIYTTIHDVLYLDLPQLTTKIGKLIRKYFLSRAIKISTGIFTVSNFSKRRILHHFKTSKPIEVCYNGINLPSFISNINFDNRSASYFLFIGNIKPHKGIDVLIKAFKKYKEKTSNPNKLYIVGNRDSFRTALKLNNLDIDQSDIIFTGFLDEESLIKLIKNATCLIQPSLYEGFGIPPLEAMSLGTPVIVSDIPVFKEIYDRYPVIYFKKGNVNDLSKMMESNFQRVTLSQDQRSKYSYRTTANLILSKFQI